MSEGQPRVLVVDDERFYREAIAETLGQAGFACEVAESAQAALAACAKERFGAVVLDVGLPGGAGLDVLRRLREREPTVRVIVLATQAEHESVLESLRLGACDYLAKPLHDEELGLAVDRALCGYAVESRWTHLRDRICALDARIEEIEARARGLSAGQRLEALGREIVDSVAAVLGATRASMMLLAPGEGRLRVVAALGQPVDLGSTAATPAGAGVAGPDAPSIGGPTRSGYRSASLVATPIPGDAADVGVLCATDRAAGGVFGAEDLALLRLLARHVGELARDTEPAADRAAGLAAPGEEVADDAELARAICDAMTNEVDPDRVIEASLRVVARELAAAPVALHLIDDRSGRLGVERQVEGSGPADRDRLDRSRGLTGTVLQSGHLVATDHPEKDPRFEPEIDTPADGEVRPLICVPIQVRGKILGVLRVFPGRPDLARARTAEVLAAAVSAAVRSALLYRSLLESIDEVARARRASRGQS